MRLYDENSLQLANARAPYVGGTQKQLDSELVNRRYPDGGDGLRDLFAERTDILNRLALHLLEDSTSSEFFSGLCQVPVVRKQAG